MPRGNGMGPVGQGPMTGRGAGFCVGSERAGFESNRGRGFGGGRGGHRNRFFATGLTYQEASAAPFSSSDADDLAVLTRKAEACEAALLKMKARIQAFEKKEEA